MTEESSGNLLDWLDKRNDWLFVGILYAVRWLVLAPIGWLIDLIFTQSQLSGAKINSVGMDAPLLFLVLVVVDPLFETVLECTLPYWVVSRVRNYRLHRPKRPWGYVAVSAAAMCVLHPLASILYALITGVFLAYCYAHFASGGIKKAIFMTAFFHGAINIVGWTLIIMS